MSLIDRLEKSAASKGLSLSAVAEKAGASRASATRWRSGGGLSPSMLKKISKILDVDPEWLKDGIKPSPIEAFDNNVELIPSRKVPLISLVQAGDWTEAVDPYSREGGSEKTESCPVTHGENTFAVRVNGESMSPKFEHGEVIFCDPSVQPNNKDYVIAKLTDNNEATFKQLIIEDGQSMLKAINPNWPAPYIQINGNCVIVGKVIARLEKF